MVNSQVSSYIAHPHHLTLLITPFSSRPFPLASTTANTFVFPPTSLDPPFPVSLGVPLLLLVLLGSFYMNTQSFDYLTHLMGLVTIYIKDFQIYISTPDLSLSFKTQSMYSLLTLLEWTF